VPAKKNYEAAGSAAAFIIAVAVTIMTFAGRLGREERLQQLVADIGWMASTITLDLDRIVGVVPRGAPGVGTSVAVSYDTTSVGFSAVTGKVGRRSRSLIASMSQRSAMGGRAVSP
jgi:hypothetical protein